MLIFLNSMIKIKSLVNHLFLKFICNMLKIIINLIYIIVVGFKN